jgi:hypothetical protein
MEPEISMNPLRSRLTSIAQLVQSRTARAGTALAAAACLLFAAGQVASQPASDPKKPNDQLENMDPSKFDRPTVIDNKWLPLKPGTRYTYSGSTIDDDGKLVPHTIVLNVTDLTKVIGGVRTLVTYDIDYTNKEIVEAELVFVAQDNEGTVWHFGEYPEEYDGKRVVKSPAWLHGIQGARAGIFMKANPQPGTPSYSQGWGPAVGWTDRGQVFKVGEKTKVRAGNYSDVLVIKESSREEGEDAYQLKYYAPGVGNVRVGWGGKKEKSKETL